MKKFLMVFVSMAIALIGFTSCGESKKAKETSEVAVEEVVVKEAPASDSNEAIEKYFVLIEKMLPMMESITKGDANAMTEYQKIASEMSELVVSEGFTSALQKLTPEQMAKYDEISKKYQDQAMKMAGGK